MIDALEGPGGWNSSSAQSRGRPPSFPHRRPPLLPPSAPLLALVNRCSAARSVVALPGPRPQNTTGHIADVAAPSSAVDQAGRAIGSRQAEANVAPALPSSYQQPAVAARQLVALHRLTSEAAILATGPATSPSAQRHSYQERISMNRAPRRHGARSHSRRRRMPAAQAPDTPSPLNELLRLEVTAAPRTLFFLAAARVAS